MAENSSKVCLVTGGTGLLGKRIIEKLGETSGYHVRALTRRKQNFHPNVEWVEGTLEDVGTLEKAVHGVELVLHAAGVTHADDAASYFRVNTAGTKNLVDASKEAGVKRFIYVSTRAAYPTCGAYGESKRRAELYVKESGIPYVIFRPAEIVGGGREGVEMLVRLVKALPLVPYPAGDIRLSPVLVDDVVSAVIRAVGDRSLQGKEYTLSGQSYSLRVLLGRMAEHMGKRRLFIPVPLDLLSIFSSIARFFGISLLVRDQFLRLTCKKDEDYTLAYHDLGYSPREIFGREKE